MTSEIEPVGHVRSPYKQKFAIPRQPNLVPEAVAEIHFERSYSDPNLFREIDQFSHLWLIFQFHETRAQGWSPTVQPPRLGGRERVGVFASRSPYRPNSLGLSVVTNLGLDTSAANCVLTIGGVDLLDGTPVFDIKPYVPYADSLPLADAGFADSTPGNNIEIEFSKEAQDSLAMLRPDYPQLQNFITSLLKQDPRPAWRVREGDNKQYGMTLYDFNIKWRVTDSGMKVVSILPESDQRRSPGLLHNGPGRLNSQ